MFFQTPQSENEMRRERMTVPVPFLQEESGLGDLIKRATSALGIQPCGGCQKRAEALNERVVFVPWDEA